MYPFPCQYLQHFCSLVLLPHPPYKSLLPVFRTARPRVRDGAGHGPQNTQIRALPGVGSPTSTGPLALFDMLSAFPVCFFPSFLSPAFPHPLLKAPNPFALLQTSAPPHHSPFPPSPPPPRQPGTSSHSHISAFGRPLSVLPEILLSPFLLVLIPPALMIPSLKVTNRHKLFPS